MTKPKTNPQLQAVSEEHGELRSKDASGEVVASYDKKGFTLKLGPELSERLGRWLFRAVVMGLLGYLGLSKATGADTKPTEDLAARVDQVEANLAKIMKKLGVEE